MWSKMQPLCTVSGNVNWCSHYEEQYGGPQKIRNRTIIQSSYSTFGKTKFKKIYAPVCSLQHYLQ